MKSKLLFIVLLVASFLQLVVTCFKTELLYNLDEVFSAFILFLMSVFFMMLLRKYNDLSHDIGLKFGSILLTFYFIISILIGVNVIQLPERKVVGNFVNENISDALKWASENKIKVTQLYENSDTFPMYHIISQNVDVEKEVNRIKKIQFVVSSGPNYQKRIVIPNMVGWETNQVLDFIKQNYLIHTTAEFIVSEQTKDTLISQDKNGEQSRDTEIKFVFSIGSIKDLGEIELIDFSNQSLFEATFFLKRNGLSYQLDYQFNEETTRDHIISQSIKSGSKITNQDQIILTVSKGKEIKVPDLMSMKMEEITNWIIDNKLKVKFEEKYDASRKLGDILSINYKKGDLIEEGSLVVIATSKGQLKVPNVSSISELRNWASTYSIGLNENYEFNNQLSAGKIISMIPSTGESLNSGGSITVKISQGKAITIPNFVGKNKTSISSECRTLGLNCTFTYNGYSSTPFDMAVTQNKKTGSIVINGTYVSIGLSLGAAKTYTVEISEAQLSLGNADKTISTLTNWFNSNYPNVKFTFTKKASNTYSNAGFIHENSPIKDGSKVTQGNSYQVWITN